MKQNGRLDATRLQRLAMQVQRRRPFDFTQGLPAGCPGGVPSPELLKRR